MLAALLILGAAALAYYLWPLAAIFVGVIALRQGRRTRLPMLTLAVFIGMAIIWLILRSKAAHFPPEDERQMLIGGTCLGCFAYAVFGVCRMAFIRIKALARQLRGLQ